MSNEKNIKSQPWRAIGWQDDQMMQGLTQLRDRVEKQALDAINWYYAKKKSKNLWSRWLRFWAITYTILGGLVPILSATGIIGALFVYLRKGAYDEDTRLVELHFNQLGYILIGLAAGCVAFDRFFGFSTNWMRYIGAAMRIETDRIRFHLEWERLVAPLKGKEPGEERLQELLETVEKFSLGIREAVEQETGAWISEFQTNLAQLDKETKSLFESARNEKRAIEQRSRPDGAQHPRKGELSKCESRIFHPSKAVGL